MLSGRTRLACPMHFLGESLAQPRCRTHTALSRVRGRGWGNHPFEPTETTISYESAEQCDIGVKSQAPDLFTFWAWDCNLCMSPLPCPRQSPSLPPAPLAAVEEEKDMTCGQTGGLSGSVCALCCDQLGWWYLRSYLSLA